MKNTYNSILLGSRCYLAGNIENSTDSFSWREKAANILSSIGVICLDPTNKIFESGKQEDKKLKEKLFEKLAQNDIDYVRSTMQQVIYEDLRAVDLSDFLLFNFEFQKPTFGTMHELVIANQQSKACFIISNCKLNKVPLWILGLIKKEHIYENLDLALETILKINLGEIKLSSKKWKLLRKEIR